MAISRVTQNMLAQRSLGSLQSSLSRLGRLQDQLSSGRVLNRPSDSPTGTTTAMRLRDDLAATKQYQRNAQDGLAWLGLTDSTLQSATDQLREARDVGIRSLNVTATSQSAREALATTVDQLRTSLLSTANTSYLGRPVFGGVTAGSQAYDATGTYVGTPPGAVVTRTVGDGVKVRVDTDATAAFGPAGNDVFGHLTDLSTALRAGNTAGIQAANTALNADLDRLAAANAEVGTRYKQVDAAQQKGADGELATTTRLSEVENVDLPKVMMELQLQETAYKASLSATSRVMQPSLLDFLR